MSDSSQEGAPGQEESSGAAAGPQRRLRSSARWFVTGLTPGDVVTALSVVIAGIGVWLAFRQFRDSLAQEAAASREAAQASRMQAQQTEDNAPFLIPATPPAERGSFTTVALNFGDVTKRADRLYVAPPHPKSGINAARVVIPLQNGGSGIALIIGKPAFVSNCARANAVSRGIQTMADPSYVVRSGEADQYGFFQPHAPGGTIRGGGWFTFDYDRWGRSHRVRGQHGRRLVTHYEPSASEVNPSVIVWYTDGARAVLRWVCATYVFAGVGRGGLQYAVTGTLFGRAAVRG